MTVLVTGASRGLGAALALALAPEHHVICVARTVGALEELDDRIQAKGGSATLAPMDVTNRDAMAQLCRSIHDRWGGLALWAHTAVHAPPLTPAELKARTRRQRIAIRDRWYSRFGVTPPELDNDGPEPPPAGHFGPVYWPKT